MKNRFFKYAGRLISMSILGLAVYGCGGDDDEGGNATTTSTVSGVAATGAPMSGAVFLKDAANNPEMNQTLNAQTGAFSFDVSGRTAPFILRSGSLYSMSGGPGTANINPLSHLMVADMGGFGNMSSLNSFYVNPDGTRLRTMFDNVSTARLHLRQTMDPLMSTYGVPNADPISGPFTIGQGMDRMFDDVKMAIDANGGISMLYKSGTPVYTGQMGNMAGGTMRFENITTPGAPASGITITPGVARLQPNATLQFRASIQVTWAVISQNGGSITSGGLYTAPALQGMFLVRATSAADPTKSEIVTVMVGNRGMMM
ncbi:MAG: hypothetical protein H7X83_04090 [Verrucomicrobia bacterium]|nr:hypothetical protein [Deltaproteobacteria bacterium]